jgi:hypothetical protein
VKLDRGILAALAAAALFGLSTPVAKTLLGAIFPSAARRTSLHGFRHRPRHRAHGPAISRGRASIVRPRGAALLWLLGAIAFGGAIGPYLLMYGLQMTDSASASLILNLEGVFTALLAWFAFWHLATSSGAPRLRGLRFEPDAVCSGAAQSRYRTSRRLFFSGSFYRRCIGCSVGCAVDPHSDYRRTLHGSRGVVASHRKPRTSAPPFTVGAPTLACSRRTSSASTRLELESAGASLALPRTRTD